MPFWRLYYHLVWATKNREPFIESSRLFAHILRKAAKLDVRAYASDGWYDHVHLSVVIPPKHAVAQVVKRLKGASSHYLDH